MSESRFELFRPPPEPPIGPRQKFWRKVPVLGWVVGGYLEMSRLKPKWREVCDQIALRNEEVWQTWGRPARLRVAKVVCRKMQEEFGWPNPYYLPDDRLKILCTRWAPDVEFIFAVYEIEKELKIKLGRHYASLIFGEKGEKVATATIGEFVDFILPEVEKIALQ